MSFLSRSKCQSVKVKIALFIIFQPLKYLSVTNLHIWTQSVFHSCRYLVIYDLLSVMSSPLDRGKLILSAIHSNRWHQSNVNGCHVRLEYMTAVTHRCLPASFASCNRPMTRSPSWPLSFRQVNPLPSQSYHVNTLIVGGIDCSICERNMLLKEFI